MSERAWDDRIYVGAYMIAEIRDVTKKYKNNICLNKVNLTLEGGKCYGLIGRNGTGKTSLISILAGVRTCESGEFLLDGVNLFRSAKLHTSSVAYVPQSNPLIPELSGYDNLRLFYSSEKLNRELKEGVLKRLGIDEFVDTRVSRMSGGMKKRLSIGCAVNGNPKILLLDEPGAALDLICKETIRKYICEFKENGGIVLLSTHEAEEIAVCDEHYILKDGNITKYNFTGNIEALVNEM